MAWRGYLVSGLALALLLWVALRAVMDPLLCWDPFFYHLPLAIMLWKIGGGAANTFFYQLTPFYMHIGVVGEWFQGLLWTLFGSANVTPLVNIIPFYMALYFARKWLGVSWIALALLALSMPMIAIHATSAYIDLMIGSLIFLAVIAALRFIERGGWQPLTLLFIASVLAGNAKFTALPPVVAILLFTLWKLRFRSWKISAVIMLGMLCASGQMIDNFARYGNPVFPFNMTLPGGVQFYGPRPEVPHSLPPYMDNIAGGRGIYFLLSVSELDWLLDMPQRFYYSEAAQAGDERYVQRRTGGFFGPLVILQLLFIGASMAAFRKRAGLQMVRNASHYFAVLTFVYMLQPESHELRYCFAWALMLCLLSTLYFAVWVRENSRAYYYVLAGLAALLLLVQLGLPLQRNLFSLHATSYYPEAVKKRLDPEVLDFIRAHHGACVKDVPGPYGYDRFGACPVSNITYSSAFTRENYQLELSDCTLPKAR